MQDSAPTSDADGSDAAEGTTLDAMYGFDSAEFNLEVCLLSVIHAETLADMEVSVDLSKGLLR